MLPFFKYKSISNFYSLVILNKIGLDSYSLKRDFLIKKIYLSVCCVRLLPSITDDLVLFLFIFNNFNKSNLKIQKVLTKRMRSHSNRDYFLDSVLIHKQHDYFFFDFYFFYFLKYMDTYLITTALKCDQYSSVYYHKYSLKERDIFMNISSFSFLNVKSAFYLKSLISTITKNSWYLRDSLQFFK